MKEEIYKVKVNKKKTLYLPKGDALFYASRGSKIKKVKKLPKGYNL